MVASNWDSRPFLSAKPRGIPIWCKLYLVSLPYVIVPRTKQWLLRKVCRMDTTCKLARLAFMANLQFIINHQVIVGNIVNLNFSPIYTYSYISFSSFVFGYNKSTVRYTVLGYVNTRKEYNNKDIE